MKTLLLSLTFFIQFACFSQDTLTTYFDAEWNACEQVDAHYFRKTYPKASNLWGVEDYFESGQLQMRGQYLEQAAKTQQGDFVWYHESGEVSRKGAFEQGKREGTWKDFESDGTQSVTHKYKDGIRVSAKLHGENVNKVYGIVEQMPQFGEGIADITKHINRHVRYPKAARNLGIHGTVYLTFIVEKNGEVSNVEILRGVGGGCDEEAIRVVKTLKNWEPGRHYGQKVRVRFNLPIRFALH